VIDFHCHLDLFQNPLAVATEADARGTALLSVTTTPSAWLGTLALAEKRPSIRTALGLHPELAGERRHELELFERFLPSTSFVGEVGLDGSPQQKPHQNAQLIVFEHVLRACEMAGGKMISVHSRRAEDAVLRALERYPNAGSVVLHWFSGTVGQVDRAVQQGCWFSVGPAMLAGAKGRALVARLPSDRVVAETDGPFGRSGNRPLSPWDVVSVVPALSAVWKSSSDDARDRLDANERKLLQSALGG